MLCATLPTVCSVVEEVLGRPLLLLGLLAALLVTWLMVELAMRLPLRW